MARTRWYAVVIHCRKGGQTALQHVKKFLALHFQAGASFFPPLLLRPPSSSHNSAPPYVVQRPASKCRRAHTRTCRLQLFRSKSSFRFSSSLSPHTPYLSYTYNTYHNLYIPSTRSRHRHTPLFSIISILPHSPKTAVDIPDSAVLPKSAPGAFAYRALIFPLFGSVANLGILLH